MRESHFSPLDTRTKEAAELSDQPAEKVAIDRTRSATVQIFEYLLHDIITLRLKPAEPISIVYLSKVFGTSRSPVREALIRLEHTGLVETFPQAGTRVTPIRMEEVREVHFVRKAIEVAMIEILANRSNAEHCSILMGIIDQHKKYTGEDTIGEFYSFDEKFHQKIAELAEYPNVWRLMQNQKYQMDRLRYMVVPFQSRSSQILEEHAAIVKEIETGDAVRARDAMIHHLQQVFVLQKILQNHYPDYFID